jgi:hypothetical protein
MSLDRSSSPILKTVWLPLALMLAALILRALTAYGVLPATLGNFSPLVAFAFAGAVVFPRTLPWWSWLVILIALDFATYGPTLGSTFGDSEGLVLNYACYALAAWAGSQLRGRAGIVDTLIGTLICSVLFYFVTNTLSWWANPAYPKDLGGWVQALTVGAPGPWPSTLVFFRNSLIADMLGAAVLLAVYNGEAIARNLSKLPWLGRPGATA